MGLDPGAYPLHRHLAGGDGIVEIVWGFQMRNDSNTLREVEDVVREHVYEAKKAS